MKKKFLKKISVLLKIILPNKWFTLIIKIFTNIKNINFKHLSTQEMFELVYAKNLWGNEKSSSLPFYSGPGSHDSNIVRSYTSAITKFIGNFTDKITALDVGCGDFNIGSKLYLRFDKYIAIDIVEPLIKFNSTKWVDNNLEFKFLNVIEDEIPAVDIIFIREVLQHLRNFEIEKILKNMNGKCSWLVITEFLPGPLGSFEHNLDRGVGPGTRANIFSGVVLTSPPFNLIASRTECLMQLNVKDGIIRTDAYCLD